MKVYELLKDHQYMEGFFKKYCYSANQENKLKGK
jgi:hypothetical protein